MFEAGDSVRFVNDTKLGWLSNKGGYVERKLSDDEIAFEDKSLEGQNVYEVWVPLYGNICVLESFIKPATKQ